MNVVVRPCASVEDGAAIGAAAPTGPSQWHRQRFELDDGSTYLLAWIGDSAVGHAHLLTASKYDEVRERLGTFPEVNGLGVVPAHRRQGVARALMSAAAEETLRQGYDLLGLAVEEGNEAARTLYVGLGFDDAGIHVVDEWVWLDEDGDEHLEQDPCDYWVWQV
jgi:GNAT superfamily N-acetyltransferase